MKTPDEIAALAAEKQRLWDETNRISEEMPAEVTGCLRVMGALMDLCKDAEKAKKRRLCKAARGAYEKLSACYLADAYTKRALAAVAAWYKASEAHKAAVEEGGAP